jgi:hypothetical protein
MFKIEAMRKQYMFVFVALIIIAVAIGTIMAGDYGNLQGTFIVLTGIGILAFFLFPRLVHQDEKNFLPKILFLGLIAKIVSVFIRLWIDFGLGVSVSDAIGYMRNGAIVARHIWHLDFSQLSSYLTWGIPFMNLVTGVVYSIIGITRNGGYLVFSLISFMGSYFFYRAYTIVFPNENRRLFAIYVFFLPSILFWANGIGKDALILFFISLCAYGAAKYFVQKKFTGLIISIISLVGAFFVRPHIASILAVSFVAGYLLQGIRQKFYRSYSFYLVVISAGLALIILLPKIASIIGVPGLSIPELLNYLNSRQDLTAIGGSTFTAVNISNPLNIPYLFITVFFRPFPWEANNFQAVIQSAEGLLVLGVLIWQFRSIKKALRLSVSNGYVFFILVYIVTFVLTFSSVTNFGILARQRVMMYPLLFMLLAFKPAPSRNNAKITEKSNVTLVQN